MMGERKPSVISDAQAQADALADLHQIAAIVEKAIAANTLEASDDALDEIADIACTQEHADDDD